MPNDNMFITSTDADKAFEVFPEVAMKNSPIYKAANKYETGVYRFDVKTGPDLVQLLQTCRDLQQNPNSNVHVFFCLNNDLFSCPSTTSKSTYLTNRS